MVENALIPFKPLASSAEKAPMKASDLVDRFVDAVDTDELLRLLYEASGKQCCIIYPDQHQLVSVTDDFCPSFSLSRFVSKLHDAVRLSQNENLLFLEYEEHGAQTGALLSYTDEKESCVIVMWDVDIQNASLLKDYNYLFMLSKIFLKQNKRVHKNLIGERNEFLQSLLEGYPMTDEEIFRRMKKYDCQLNAPYFYLIVTSFSSTYDEKNILSPANDNLRHFAPFFEYVAAKYRVIGGVTKKNNLFFIVPSEKAASQHTSIKDAEMVNVLHRQLDERNATLSFTSGVSLMHSSSGGFNTSYNQAYTALRHTLSLFGKGTVLSFKDMGLFKLLLSNPLRPQLKGFLMDYFEPLLSLEREEIWPLLETMYAYVICGFNSRECARKIYVHHHTIRYRLAKIESLCSLDLKKPADLITMLVCLEILKLCPDYMQQIHNLERLITTIESKES